MNTRKPSSTRRDFALDGQLCLALYSTIVGINKACRPLLKALDPTHSQYLAMLALWEQDAQTVSEIGERLFLDSATPTPLLKRLEAAGLIERQRSVKDERWVITSLTAAGKVLEKRAEKVPAYMAATIECALGELEELHIQLNALRERLFENAA